MKTRRRRRNPGSGTLVLVAGVGIVAFLGYRALTAAPTPSSDLVPADKRPTFDIPTDIMVQMVYVWSANGKPTDKTTWVRVMQTVLPLTPVQWGKVFDLGIGFNRWTGNWAGDKQVYDWVVAAASS